MVFWCCSVQILRSAYQPFFISLAKEPLRAVVLDFVAKVGEVCLANDGELVNAVSSGGFPLPPHPPGELWILARISFVRDSPVVARLTGSSWSTRHAYRITPFRMPAVCDGG
jgi:hypothetical protein